MAEEGPSYVPFNRKLQNLVGEHFWCELQPGTKAEGRRALKRRKTTRGDIGIVVVHKKVDGTDDKFIVRWLCPTSKLIGDLPWVGAAEYTIVNSATWVMSREELDRATKADNVFHYADHAKHAYRTGGADCCMYYRTEQDANTLKIKGIGKYRCIDSFMLLCCRCSKEVNSETGLFCYRCYFVQHADCNDTTKSPWQIVRKDNSLRDCNLNVYVCKVCKGGVPLLASTDPPEPEKPHTGALFIDIGSHRVRVLGLIDGQDLKIDCPVASAAWVNKTTMRVGSGTDKAVGYSKDNIMIDPIKILILDDVQAFDGLPALGITMSRILTTFFTTVIREAVLQMLPAIQAWNGEPVEWTLSIAVPAGLSPYQASKVGRALLRASQTFKVPFQCKQAATGAIGLASLAPLSSMVPRIVIQREPTMALLANDKTLEGRGHAKQKQFTVLVDLGATTACLAIYSCRPNKPAVLIAAISLVSGTVKIAQLLSSGTPTEDLSLLKAAVDARPCPPDESAKAFRDSISGSTANSPDMYQSKAEEFTHILDHHRQSVVECFKRNTLKNSVDWMNTRTFFLGGGTIDVRLMADLKAAVRDMSGAAARQVPPPEPEVLAKSYSAINSPELEGLRLHSEAKISLDLAVPFYVFFSIDTNRKLDDDSQCMVLLKVKGAPVVDPVCSVDQIKQGEPVFLELQWNEDEQYTKVPFYATTDDVEFDTVNGLRCIKKDHDFVHVWTLATINVPRPAGNPTQAINLMFYNIDIVANTVVVVGAVGVLDPMHAGFDKFSGLTLPKFKAMLAPEKPYKEYTTVAVLDQEHTCHSIEHVPPIEVAQPSKPPGQYTLLGRPGQHGQVPESSTH
ncbi:hypothetical protein K505DRAFT_367693 [Melanomma pulvis-pyrius CBS 109.77]|uniref:Uncharacterized protein n=1 Tax=Melanomma pulvis-pyrius CBS 109.77 TaxID=1314802 RepID=A0A6A6WSG4_9PLEO|nr:hypothetical protein K505DRAFT_367693 [Melanomma pulvis-pyrius CBS 109.77]